DNLRQETADLLLGIQDETENIRLAGSQPQTGTAGMVAQFPRHILNGSACRDTDLVIVTQGARDSRDAQTQRGRDGFQCRFLAAGFQINALRFGLLLPRSQTAFPAGRAQGPTPSPDDKSWQ